jgi:hypothetical protein
VSLADSGDSIDGEGRGSSLLALQSADSSVLQK